MSGRDKSKLTIFYWDKHKPTISRPYLTGIKIHLPYRDHVWLLGTVSAAEVTTWNLSRGHNLERSFVQQHSLNEHLIWLRNTIMNIISDYINPLSSFMYN